jgi:hypothetical protein
MCLCTSQIINKRLFIVSPDARFINRLAAVSAAAFSESHMAATSAALSFSV